MIVGGLLPTLTTKDLLNYFSQFGEIEKGIIMTDKLTGKSRGFGVIIFNQKETIDKIMEKGNCHFLNGKIIECKRAKPKIQSMKILHEKEFLTKFNSFNNNNNNHSNSLNNNNDNDNNIINNNNNNKKRNDEIIINYSLKSLGKPLIKNKNQYRENLFIFQSYIPKKNEINFLSNIKDLQINKKLNYLNKNYKSNNKIENQSNNKKNESQNEKMSNNNKNQINQFQDYFNNQLKNPSSYNFIHFKLYDSNGEEVSKLSNYKRNTLKIKLFPEELDDYFEKNQLKININSEKENNEEKNKKDNCNYYNEFGPDRSSCRKGKTRSSIFNNNESFKPY